MADRIVVSGRGLLTPVGTGLLQNTQSLREGRTGTVLIPEWRENGIDSQVAGAANHDPECPVLNQKNKRFMSENAKMAVYAAYEAFTDAGYTMETIPAHTAVINGCAGSSYAEVWRNAKVFEKTGRANRVSPFSVPRIMPSSAVATLSLVFGLKGESYDISSACTSSALAIMAGARLILSGEYDQVLVGGSEEISLSQALGFNAMHALARSRNDDPGTASRPFDKSRDGFVLGEGAGMLVLERESTALARGIRPKAVLAGFASNSNAADMVMPDASSSAEVMRLALKNARLAPEEINYINAHGTATSVGDPVEMTAIKDVFHASHDVWISSTKSMTGHTIGAAGAIEAVFSLLMMENSFVCPTANLKDPEDDFAWANLPVSTVGNVKLDYIMSNSFGFGGSNVSLIFGAYK